MSLNPSNAISERITGRRAFPNVAGLGKRDPAGVDAILKAELQAAGIGVDRLPECIRETQGGEPRSIVIGTLHGWLFRRAWYYWTAEGPGIPPDDAMALHATHGTSVRVDGHCGCPSPLEWFKGFACGHYHVDNPEGLKALADTINAVAERCERGANQRESKT